MNEEQMPGTSSADQDVNRRWREQSAEEPASLVDARIRNAARQALESDGPQRAARRSARWTKFVPLAAAASVALLAVGLVRLIPREEYQVLPQPDVMRRDEARGVESAVPGSGVTRRDEAREAGSAPPAAPARASEEGGRSSTQQLSAPIAAARPAEGLPAADSLSRKELERQAASRRASSPDEQPRRTDNFAAETDAPRVPDQNVATQTDARPVQALGTTPRSKVAAPTANGSDAAAVVSPALRSADALGPAIPETLAAQIRSDAARRIGADPDSIRIRAIEPTVWPDASLGCGSHDDHAEAARVPGYVVTVEAPDATLRYHTDDRDRITVCEGE